MSILDNFENSLDLDSLAIKYFSETVCKDCLTQSESRPILDTDNMGRAILWDISPQS
jgi:hypothetical protein